MRQKLVLAALLVAALGISTHSHAQTAGTTGRWDLRGNSTTNPAINFLGTTDAKNLNFRTNNIQRMNLTASEGNLGLGMAATFDTRFSIWSEYNALTSDITNSLFITNEHTGNVAGGGVTQTGINCYVLGDNGTAPGNDVIGGKFFAQTVRGTATGLQIDATTFSPATAYGVRINTSSPDGGSGVYSFINGAVPGSTIHQHAIYGEAAAKPYSWAGWFQGNMNVTDTGVIKRLRVGTTFSITSPNLIQVGSTTGDGISIGSQEFIRDGGANILLHKGSLRPDINALYSIGSSTLRYTTVYATNGTINTSDRRDKTNIEQLHYGINDIMKLNPVSFTWKDRSDEGTKLGLIAQELQTVLPEVVRDYDIEIDEATGKTKHIEAERLGVFYSDIIPVLIKGIQEQQQQIEGLQQMIEKLLQNNTTGLNDVASDKNNYSLVSNPNPATGKTNITFNIPAHSKNAQLTIMDAAGKKVRSFSNLIAGANTVVFETTSLNAGSYIYSLNIDGKIVDTKILSVVK